MVTGDLTVTKIGVFKDTTIAAGVTGQNCGAATAGAETATFIYVPFSDGQILVLKQARAA